MAEWGNCPSGSSPVRFVGTCWFDSNLRYYSGVVDTINYPLGGLKPCMDAMCTLRKHQTRGEAIIRRRDGSLEIQIVKAGVLQSDTNRMSS